MLILFSALAASEDDDAQKVVDFMEPGTTLLTNFLPSFFIPALIVAPLATRNIASIDIAKFLSVISIGLPSVLVFTGHLIQLLQKLSGQTLVKTHKKPKGVSTVKPSSWFSPALEKMFIASTAGSAILSLALPWLKGIFYVSTTFLSFIFASRIPRVFPDVVRQYWHPLMSTYSMATVILLLFSKLAGQEFFTTLAEYFVGGGSPFAAAGNFVMFWLEPSIISFAFGKLSLYCREKIHWN